MKKLTFLSVSVLMLALAACGDNIRPGSDSDDDDDCLEGCPSDVDPPDAGTPTPDADTGPGTDAGTGGAPDAGVPEVVCTPEEVLLCHVPPGNPSDAHVACVGPSAVQVHLDHGDALGACP